MKLKYYLRGIGIGVIVATLIMTVSSVIHNNNLSDEVIIKEAQKLGMIMPEDTEDSDSLWGSDTEETQKEDEVSSENVESDTTVLNEDTESSQETEDSQQPEDSQQAGDESVALITITDSDAARHVSEKLQAAGLIEDPVDFRNYLADKGYATDIISGTFEIKKGSTYEDICDIIIKK